ncbi:MAG TPA: YceD family protein [Burkholderiales bacterium]|nr:YceD family protein [Burkholderiales bacterium]
MLRGNLPLAGLARLKDSLADALGAVEFEVRGGEDTRRRPVLTVSIHGTLRLQCQRCLEALDHPLRVLNTLVLVTGSAVPASELDDEDGEWIEASRELDLAALIEDEILLSLPYAPRHEEGTCRPLRTAATDSATAAAFAGLAALKRNNH